MLQEAIAVGIVLLSIGVLFGMLLFIPALMDQ